MNCADKDFLKLIGGMFVLNFAARTIDQFDIIKEAREYPAPKKIDDTVQEYARKLELGRPIKTYEALEESVGLRDEIALTENIKPYDLAKKVFYLKNWHIHNAVPSMAITAWYTSIVFVYWRTELSYKKTLFALTSSLYLATGLTFFSFEKQAIKQSAILVNSNDLHAPIKESSSFAEYSTFFKHLPQPLYNFLKDQGPEPWLIESYLEKKKNTPLRLKRYFRVDEVDLETSNLIRKKIFQRKPYRKDLYDFNTLELFLGNDWNAHFKLEETDWHWEATVSPIGWDITGLTKNSAAQILHRSVMELLNLGCTKDNRNWRAFKKELPSFRPKSL